MMPLTYNGMYDHHFATPVGERLKVAGDHSYSENGFVQPQRALDKDEIAALMLVGSPAQGVGAKNAAESER